MKHTVYGISLAIVTILVVAIVLGISGKHVRKHEMETSLNTAIEQSLEQLRTRKGYKMESPQELIADFNQLLLLQMESDSDFKVEILGVDAGRGVLDVRLTETYQNILGKEEQAVCRKSVILEEYSDKKTYHTITFLTSGEIYVQYSLYEGGKIVLPDAPQKDEKAFRCWMKQGESQEFDLEHTIVDEDLTLEAVFE